MFIVIKKTGLRIYQYKKINNNVKMLNAKISRSYVHTHTSINCEVLICQFHINCIYVCVGVFIQ